MATKLKDVGDTYSAILNNFAGVDFSSPLLSVADNHAVDMKNFLKIDDVNQKRKGWITRLQLPYHINGFWNFKTKSGTTYYVAHAGKKLYSVSLSGNDVYDYKEIDTSDLGIEDFKSSAVYSNERLYIFCGILVVVKFNSTATKLIAKKVQDDSETTIPLTTMGITENDSALGGTRVALDDVNMMTKWRYNSLCSHTLSADKYPSGDIKKEKADVSKDNPIDFILDGKIGLFEYKVPSIGPDMRPQIEKGLGGINQPILEITYLDGEIKKTISVKGIEQQNPLGYKFTYNTIEIGFLENPLVDNIEETSSQVGLKQKIMPYGERRSENAVLHLYKDYINPLDGEDNILIKYDGSLDAGADKINCCRFCKVYGYGGNRDTLFASGNPSYPNLDFHTSNNAQSRYKTIQNRTFGDFTYWSDLGYNSYGSDANSVSNYEVMGDGTLCVLKTESEKESTIYFRKGEFVQARSYDGVLIDSENNLQEIDYPCSVGSIGEAPYPNDRTMLNLNGDTLFLSKNGLFGLSYSSNLNSSQRYSYARSRLVNKRLLGEELNKATACVFDNKYWLAFPNGHCYVFDGRYKFKLQDDLSSDFQYECFYLDNIPARGFMVEGNKLFFYTEDGMICELLVKQDIYHDTIFLKPEEGDYTLNETNHLLTFNSAFLDKVKARSKEGYSVSFHVSSEDKLYERIGHGIQVIDEYKSIELVDNKQRFKARLKKPSQFYNGEKIVLLSNTEKYFTATIEETDDYGVVYIIVDTTEDIQLLVVMGSYLKSCDNKDYEVVISSSGNVTIKGLYTDNTEFFRVEEEDYNPASYFECRKNVTCYYFTKLYNFGTSILSKTITSLTLTSDNSLYSSCKFGYRTKYEVSYDYQYNYQHGNIIGIDYADYDYTNIVYDPYNNFAQSFTYPSKIRNFNYIQFAFINDEDTNCALTSLSIVYSFGVRKRGLN